MWHACKTRNNICGVPVELTPYVTSRHQTSVEKAITWQKSFEKLPSISVQNPLKSHSPQTSLPSPRKQPQQSLSVSLSSRTQHWDHFVTYCKWYSVRSGQWQHFCSSFVGSFCSFWHYWPPNSPLLPELCFGHSVYCTPVVSVIPLRQVSVHFSQ